MTLDEIERRLATILDEARPWIPADQLADMRDLLRHGEPGVAFENLCSQLFEYDVVIPVAVWERLRLVGDQMGISADYWQRLAVDRRSGPLTEDDEPRVSDGSVCRVCGLHVTPPPWGADGRTPLFEYCPCCGVEWGYADATPAGARTFREQWLQRGGEWDEPKERPLDWDRERQLKRIPAEYR